ncbi:MAG: hypothetical protein BWY31_01735 [Lentisphaerae bacterium ADurb.Bin242]|nr:MAG: hypothetical protein BWY31_01735 [Lentisphaerae bacterium ADurb.Bin242]
MVRETRQYWDEQLGEYRDSGFTLQEYSELQEWQDVIHHCQERDEESAGIPEGNGNTAETVRKL